MVEQEGANSGVQDQKTEQKTEFLRIRVVDNTKDDHPAVNIKVPVGVVKWGIKMAQAFSPEVKDANLDWDSITEMLQESAPGKIVEVEDEAEHRTIDVWVE